MSDGIKIIAIQYEVKCLMAHENYVNERLEEAQNQGWEIAGQIMLKENTNGDGAIFFHIPIKKIVDNFK